MTDTTANTPNPTETAPNAPVKKKRRWLRWVGGLLLALVLLVILLPTIVSTGMVRSIVLGQVNKYIDGKAEVGDWSFGWLGSTSIGGVKLYDKQNILVFEADQIATKASLLGLARGHYALGDTPVSINLTKLQIRPDGTTNFHDIFKLDKSPTPKKPSNGPTSIPEVSCNLQLKLRGTIEVLDANGAMTNVVQLREGSGGTVSITDINDGIKPDLKLVYDVDNRPQSTITITGNVDAVDKGKLDIDLLTANLKVALQQVDLGALQPVLAMAGHGETKVQGYLSGDLNVLADGQKHQSVKGAIQLSKIDATHPALHGDHYIASKGDISLDIDRNAETGGDRIKCKTLVQLPQGNMDISGDIPVAALINIKDKKAPGANGWITISKDFNLSLLASEFKNSAHMIPGVVVSSGAIVNKIEITIQPDKVIAKNHTDAVATGTNPQGGAISIDPVSISADASYVSADNPIKGISDLAVVVAGKFVNIKLAGPSISKLNGSGDADLDRVRQQIAQFVDLAQLELAGKAHFNFSTDGDMTTPGSQTNVTASLTTEGLSMSLPKRPPLKFGNVTTSLSAVVIAGQTNPIDSIKTATVDFKAGDNAQSPLVDFQAKADDINIATKKIGQLNVSKCSVSSLKDAQAMLDPFVPALQQQGIALTEGSLYLVLTASIDGANQSANITQLAGSMPNVTVLRQGKQVLRREDFKFGLAGVVGNGADGLNVNLSTLSLDSALVSLHKTEAPFTARMKGAAITGTGQLDISAQLPSLNRVARAFMADSTDAEVQSGVFAGTMTLQGDNNQSSRLIFAGKVDQLTVALGKELPVQNEQFTLNLDATTDAAMKNIQAAGAIKGSYLSASASDVKVTVGAALLDMLQNAKVTVGVKDVAKAQLVARSLLPGIGNLPRLTSGGVAINLNVTRDSNARVTHVDFDFGGSRVALAQGEHAFAFNPKEKINAKWSANITGTTAIDRIEISDLQADLDVVTLSMPDKVVITNPTTDPTGTGTIEVAGDIQQMTPLLQVLQGSADALPFSGAFKLRQTVGNAGGALTLKGSGTVDQFAVLDAQRKPTFTEKQIALTNDLSVNLKTQSASINAINLDMASSQAAKVNITGGIDDWAKQRNLKNVVVRFDGDGYKIWTILQPMLPASMAEQFKDAKLYGPISVKLDANGPMPAGVPMTALNAKALIKVDGAEGMGLYLRNLELPLTLRDGQLITGDLDQPKATRFAKPAACNEGLLDLGSTLIDLRTTPYTISIAKKSRILQNVRINEALAVQLGSVASFLFEDAKKADGHVDLIVVECMGVPLSELIAKKANASFLFSIRDLTLDGPVPSMLADIMEWGVPGVVGTIDNGSLVVKDGIAYQDLTINIQKVGQGIDPQTRRNIRVETREQLTLKGGINLNKKKFENYQMWLSQGLLRKDWLKAFPNGASVELKGSLSDWQGMMRDTLIQLGVQGGINKFGGDLLDDLLNQGNKNKDKPRSRER